MSRPSIRLQRGRESSLTRRHPWVFSGALAKKPSLSPGTFIDVLSHDGGLLGSGHWGTEGIAVRMLSYGRCEDESELVFGLIAEAVARRSKLGLPAPTTTGFRLVNAEGDGLPGLTIDFYQGIAVIQCHSIGMKRIRRCIVDSLCTLLSTSLSTIVDRSPEQTPEVLYGTTTSGEFLENGHRFEVDCITGQKTGFFLDQRDSRLRVSSLAENRNVLNAFCYSGAFTVYALSGGATEVTSVDSSQKAIEQLTHNVALNGLSDRSKTVVADCLKFLPELKGEYDLIILDPPAFVKHRGALAAGRKGYETINLHAFRGIAANGLLCTFSCSQFVTREIFRDTVLSAAIKSGRMVRVLYELRQAACHPVLLSHPEGEYLKGLVLEVS